MDTFLRLVALSKTATLAVGSLLGTVTTANAATWTYTNSQNGLINVTTNVGVGVRAAPLLQPLPGSNIFPAQSFSPGYSPNTLESTSLPPDVLTGTPSNPVYLTQFRIGNFDNADRQLFIFEQLQPNVALNLANPNQLLSLSAGAVVDLDGDSFEDFGEFLNYLKL